MVGLKPYSEVQAEYKGNLEWLRPDSKEFFLKQLVFFNEADWESVVEQYREWYLDSDNFANQNLMNLVEVSLAE